MNIVINGRKITTDGNNVSVIDGKVIVDGKTVANAEDNEKIEIFGDINGNVESDRNVVVRNGEIAGDVNAKGNIDCKNVRGSVKAGGNVNCDNVQQFVYAGGNVNCDDVGSNIDAGGKVNCDDVGGDITATVVSR